MHIKISFFMLFSFVFCMCASEQNNIKVSLVALVTALQDKKNIQSQKGIQVVNDVFRSELEVMRVQSLLPIGLKAFYALGRLEQVIVPYLDQEEALSTFLKDCKDLWVGRDLFHINRDDQGIELRLQRDVMRQGDDIFFYNGKGCWPGIN